VDIVSHLDWAKEIIALDPKKEEQKVHEVAPAKTAEFPTPAKRPLFSALDCSHFEQTYKLVLSPWQKALRFAIE